MFRKRTKSVIPKKTNKIKKEEDKKSQKLEKTRLTLIKNMTDSKISRGTVTMNDSKCGTRRLDCLLDERQETIEIDDFNAERFTNGSIYVHSPSFFSSKKKKRKEENTRFYGLGEATDIYDSNAGYCMNGNMSQLGTSPSYAIDENVYQTTAVYSDPFQSHQASPQDSLSSLDTRNQRDFDIENGILEEQFLSHGAVGASAAPQHQRQFRNIQNQRDFDSGNNNLEEQLLSQGAIGASAAYLYQKQFGDNQKIFADRIVEDQSLSHSAVGASAKPQRQRQFGNIQNQRDFDSGNNNLEEQFLSRGAIGASAAPRYQKQFGDNQKNFADRIVEEQSLAQGAIRPTAAPRHHKQSNIRRKNTSDVSESPPRAQSFDHQPSAKEEIWTERSSNKPDFKQLEKNSSEAKSSFTENNIAEISDNQFSENDYEEKSQNSAVPHSQIFPNTIIDPRRNSEVEDAEQKSHEPSNSNDYCSESNNSEFGTKIDEETKKLPPFKPSITAEQLQQFSFPNCPSQDLNESERLAEKIQNSEIKTKKVTKRPNSKSGENSVATGSFAGNTSDEELFVDAPEPSETMGYQTNGTTKWKQPNQSFNVNSAPKGIVGFPKMGNWHKSSKKNTAPDPNKQLCSDKKQYIKKKKINDNLCYSARFLYHFSYFAAQGGVSYEILGKRNLLIADSDNFIARIEVAPGEELDFSKAFQQNKKKLVSRVTIIKVLEDELLVKRNEAYHLMKKILEIRSENISDFQEFAEDFLQISTMLKIYHFYNDRPHLLLQEFSKNQFISHELKCAMEHLLEYETGLQKRNQLFPRCTCPSYFSLHDLFVKMQEIRKNGLKIHKQNLIKKCSTQNSYLLCRILEINRLPVEKLLRITNDDIKLFTDLMTLTNEESQATASIIPLEFIDNLWSSFYGKLMTEKCRSLKDSGPLSHPVYFFLVKSLRDLITDIISKSTTTAQELFKKRGGDFVIPNRISWTSDCPVNQSLEKQYNLVYELMRHFEPGSYTNKNRFNYRFALLEGLLDDTPFWRNLMGRVRNQNDLFQMPEERLIWLYIVDAGIAPILHRETNERFRNLSCALLTGFLKFVQKAKHVRYESFRIAAHNIVKFAAQILPYFRVMNSVSQDLDHSILDKQIEFINVILASGEDDIISNLFSSLMEVYNEYWELRESIIGRLPQPCSVFRGLVEEMMLKILEIVDKTLSKQVDLQLIIKYLRLFNEFVKHFKGVNFTWFISKNVYVADMKDFVKEIKKGDKITYEVSDPEKLLDMLKEKDLEVPKHFLIETVLELLKIINISLNKSDWSDENHLQAAGDLFLAIGHSFAHFEDQTDYTDIELFLRDCTTPFKSVVQNSPTYSDFKIRLDNVENYYLYARKQNQIGIEQALNLCETEVRKAQENGFHTSMNRKILEECFNKYSEKLALLQNLDIPAILGDIGEQLKNVDVLPFERWTPHFKQTILPVLLADLAAIWTVLESKDVASIEKRIEPHCIQIICVLRLIGADYLKNGVPKHFAQVLTGQGKSLILGLLASLIALTGHQVNVVCYSKYLAVRDQNAFDTFFKTLDRFIQDNKISYCTFDNMAEDVLTRKINGEKLTMRTVVNDLVLNKLEKKTIEIVENPTNAVLLIDEADVFYSENIYGQTYNPCSTIGMAALREIQIKLWEIVEGSVYDKNIVLERIREFINELLKNEEYEDFKNFLSCTSALFEENLDKMVTAAITVSKEKNNPDAWFVQKYKLDYNGLICYRERLGFYSTNTYIGYNNVFNYFRLKKSNFDDKNFQNYGYFFIIWGYLSYSNLPLAYNNILGVSGTLMTLNNYEKNAIKKYGIETMSAMPSFFGERKLKFKPSEHLTIQDTVNDWHSKIFDHISRIIKANRAVLVFFETDSEMKEFENKYRNNINRLYTLIGNEEPQTMEWRINEAGVAQTVTLASRAMGRGIDYKSNDRSVEENGGVHVIQTFFSGDEKEETQLKGRTARKDNKGSYELILCREHLKEIGCNEKSDGTPISSYQELSDARLVKANSKGATIEAKIRESEKEHNLTMAFLKSLMRLYLDPTPDGRKKCLSNYPFTKPD